MQLTYTAVSQSKVMDGFAMCGGHTIIQCCTSKDEVRMGRHLLDFLVSAPAATGCPEPKALMADNNPDLFEVLPGQELPKFLE